MVDTLFLIFMAGLVFFSSWILHTVFFGEDPEREKPKRLGRSAKALLPSRPVTYDLASSHREALLSRGWERGKRGKSLETYRRDIDGVTQMLQIESSRDGGIERFRFLSTYNNITPTLFRFEVGAPERILEMLDHSARTRARPAPRILPGTDVTTMLMRQEHSVELFPFDQEGSVTIGSEHLRAPVRRLFEHFFWGYELNSSAPARPMVIEHCVYEGNTLEICGVCDSVKSRVWGATGILDQDVFHITEVLADTLERMAKSFVVRGNDPYANLATLAHNAHLTPTQRAQAARLGAQAMPSNEIALLYSKQITDNELAMQTRGEALRSLLDMHETDARREVAALVQEALLPSGEPIRRLMAIHAPDFLAEQIRGERKFTWLALLFAEGSFSSLKLSRELAASVEPSTLLDPKLDDRARGVLLINALDIWDVERASALLEEMLANLDDAQLIDILEMLRKQVSAAAARAVVSLAGKPTQIDKPSEYIALISTIRAMQHNHTEILRDERVGRFLCACLEHEDPRIARMVLSLLENLGGQEAMRRIARMIHANATEISNPRLGQVVRKIHDRIGGDALAGGLSLAERQGGELSISRGEQEGAISLAVHPHDELL